MIELYSVNMPPDFYKCVHQALKVWHKQQGESTLVTLLLARQVRDSRTLASPRLISNQILINGLDELKQLDPAAFDLLQHRFLNRETAREIAYRLNVGEDSIYQHQRTAITQLAQIIWSQEMELRQVQAHRIIARLGPPMYAQLFGIAETVTEMRTRIIRNMPPWILTIEGMGGIGKTSLVDALVRQLAYGIRFREIAWISARQQLFRLPCGIESLPKSPSLTLSDLIDQLIEQFELTGLKRQSDQEKLLRVEEYLKTHPALVVIDNLESLKDYHALILALKGLANPSKFLITTRYSLRGESGISVLHLSGLSQKDTFALIRYEAEGQGLTELANAPETLLEPIYALTHGNPLATKLIVGQVHTFALPTVLARLKAVTRRITNLLTFIYADAWQTLDQESRHVMQAMLLVPDSGGHLEQIAAASELDIGETASCLQRLATLSLIQVNGGLTERCYALHPLAHTFVAQQLAAES